MQAPVAQLDRVPGYEPGGREFESLRARQFPLCSLLASLLLSAIVGGAVPVLADPLDEAAELVRDEVGRGAASQRVVNRLDDEARRLASEHRALRARIESLQAYVRQLRGLVADQEKSIEGYRDGIARARDVGRELLPLAERMIGALDEFVGLDVPFLMDERSVRVQKLTAMLADSELSVSEKFRRIFEAYGVEADYGRTIEAWRGALDEADGQIVDFLRIGRNILIYQTLDGALLGIWDARQGSWRALDDDYRLEVRRGLRMARKTTAPGLLVLPVRITGAPPPAETGE